MPRNGGILSILSEVQMHLPSFAKVNVIVKHVKLRPSKPWSRLKVAPVAPVAPVAAIEPLKSTQPAEARSEASKVGAACCGFSFRSANLL